MRVCFLTSTYPQRAGDSTPSFVADLAEHLVCEQGCEVHVVAPGSPCAAGEETVGGVHLHRFRYAWPADRQRISYGWGITENLRAHPLAHLQIPTWAAAMLAKAMQWASHCDLLHAHWIEPGFIGSLAKRLCGVPMVLTVHRIRPRALMRAIYRATFSAADLVAYNSRFTQRAGRRMNRRGNGVVVYQGYDARRFGVSGGAAGARERLSIPPEAPLVVGLGRLVHWKGFHVLLDAWQRVAKVCPEARLVIAGGGPEKESIERLAARLGVESAVRLIGAVDKADVPALLAAADVFCNPGIVDAAGNCETLGVSVIEAMASGLPCVGSRVGGIPETIVDGKTGLLVAPNDPDALAEALIRLLKDAGLRESMGAQGRDRAREIFSWSSIARRTRELYERVLERHARIAGDGIT